MTPSVPQTVSGSPEPLRQEIPRNLQLADLLVGPGNKNLIGLMTFIPIPIEDTGRSFQQGLLPGLDLTGMYLVAGGQWATLALNDGLCFLRSFDMSHSFFTATAVAILGAELSLTHLSEFPGPPHLANK